MNNEEQFSALEFHTKERLYAPPLYLLLSREKARDSWKAT